MRDMIDSFRGWVQMGSGRSAAMKTVDTAITVVATLLVATTWALMHH